MAKAGSAQVGNVGRSYGKPADWDSIRRDNIEANRGAGHNPNRYSLRGGRMDDNVSVTLTKTEADNLEQLLIDLLHESEYNPRGFEDVRTELIAFPDYRTSLLDVLHKLENS